MPKTDALGERLTPFTEQEALVEANRCIYCYDAPCTHACPTHIDVPRFIKKIATGNLLGSARTIFDSNLMGATCSRVCPVEELCEGACVLNAEEKPIRIGRLQRHAMDYAYRRGTGVVATTRLDKPAKVAVVGAGPAGLSCAGELARRGHDVTVFEKRHLGGGLSTFGIIGLREPVPVALAEVEMIRGLGVKIMENAEIGVSITPEELRSKFDSVVIAAGLGSTPLLKIPGEEFILDGLRYIEQSKIDANHLQKGNRVLVIGAGNTAVDCATVAKRIGAAHVTMVYRRGPSEMSAYDHEYAFAKGEGIEFEFYAQPVRVIANDDAVAALECARVSAVPGSVPVPVAGSNFLIPADQIVKAIGQLKTGVAALFGLNTDRGYIAVNASLETSEPGIYAGGDCIRAKGSASTVMAAQDGKIMAAAIHGKWMAKS